MRLLVFLFPIFVGAAPENFEQHYRALQRKISELKDHGDKLTEENRRELEHSLKQLKLEYEAQVAQAKSSRYDFGDRAKSAFSELRNGFARAWEKLEQK